MKLFNLRSAKRNVLLLMMLLMAAVAGAVPAKPGLTRTLTRTDGTTITARLVGDEHGHFWLGQDGKTYTVGNEGIATAVDAEAIKAKASVRRQQANARRAKRLAPRKVGQVGSYTGQKKGIIILVSFKEGDTQFQTTNAYFRRVVNEPNFSDGNFVGSMYDYFKAQSDGQFELTFDVVGPVTVSKAHSYYGSNDSSGNDQHAAEMVIEALLLADSSVDYSDYDWDGDGEVEQVYVVYAGKGAADGGASNTIWPHAYDLYSANYYGDGDGPQTLDGVTINTYACGGELNGSTGELAGIGTMCHEFSHCLGYPDFYDTDYSGGQGMFEWDLMDSGSYNGDGYRPAGYTSYERWVAGWRTPIELTATQQINNMPALVNNGAQSYIIYNPGNSNEYFLLENRQKTGWDAGIPGAGLLILHVDYDADAWSSNTPNDTPSHQRMTWIPADNQYQYTTYQGTKYYTTSGAANDPFPYGSVNAFNKSTTPAAKFYNKNSDNTYYLDSSIENITQNSNGTVSFKFVGVSNVATPTFSPKAGRYSEAQTVTISCETSGSTIYYTLDGTAPTTSSSVYSQPLTISETTTVKAIAVADGEESATATAKYTIGQSTSNPDATTFRLVSSVDDLEPGLRYIIACGSKATAAGALNNTYLGTETVTVSNDVITIGSGVAVFVLEGDQDTGWTFQNESTNEYLYATGAKSVKYSSDEELWTLSNGNDGVVMTYGSYGTMLYNSSSPRFTTYTSNPSSSMIQANLYMEDSSAMPTIPEPFIVAEESLVFSTTVGTPQTKTFEVLTENLTENVTLTLTDQNNVFSLGQTTIANTVSDADISVTFMPTQAGTFTATVTLSSTGAESFTVTLTGTAAEPMNPDNAYTVAEVLDLFSNSNVPTDSVYVKGIVSQIKSLNTAQYQRAQYYISDNGSTTDQFYVYNGYYINKTAFTSDDQLAVGDTVIVYGQLITYTSGTTSTNEFAANNYLVYLQRPAPKQDVTLTFSSTSVTATVGETFTAPTLTINPAGISVTYSSNNTSVATVNSQTGAVTIIAAGTAVITASFAGDATYNSAPASYTINAKIQGDPGNQFRLVSNTSELASGMRYIIACGSQATAAGNLSNKLLIPVDVTMESNTITATDNVTVFVLTGNQTNGWKFQNESTNEYLYATEAKSLAYGTSAAIWTLANGTNGVEMTFGDYGTMTYNVGSPRFTTYTSPANTSMIRANLYVDASGIAKQESTLTFSETSVTTTMGETFTAPTLTTTPIGISVTYSSSNTSVATVNNQTGAVTIVAAGTTTITATFAGNDNFLGSSASYTLTVYNAQQVNSDKYELVTDASTLADGDEILIAYVNTSDNIVLALSTTQNTNNRAATDDVTLNQDGTLTPGNTAQVITLEKDGNYFLFNVDEGYLYAASSSKNWLKTELNPDVNGNATATIEISSVGDATITFQGSNTRNTMRYNPNASNGDPLFSCYAEGATTGSAPQIYRKVAAATPVPGDVNGNGTTDDTDLQILVATLLGQTPEGNINPDVDDDGEVSLKDVTKLVNIMQGLE